MNLSGGDPGNVESLELQQAGTRHDSGAVTSPGANVDSTRNVSALAPIDGGIKAWSYLLSAYAVEAIVWGLPHAFGVFLNAYMQDEKYTYQRGASTLIPLIGPTSSGIMYCSVPALQPLLHRYPKHRRTCLYIGLIFCWAGLFGASSVTKVHQLLLLQGLVYAFGGSLLYAPAISFMSEWFVKKRGLANGVIFAGTSTGGVVFPLVLPRLIESYGPAKTLRILSVTYVILILPILPFLRPRLPEIHVHGPGREQHTESSDLAIIRVVKTWTNHPFFLLAILANTVQGFAYFVPLLWLPTFASELRRSDAEASLTLALLNGFSALSRVILGIFCDKYDPWFLALTVGLFTSLSTFVLWGFLARSFAGLLAFGIAYGSLASGWTSLFTGFIRPVAKDNPRLTTSLLGVFLATRGLGNIFSTPISTALSRRAMASAISRARPSSGFNVADGRYEKMIIYVGTCFAAVGIIALLGWISDGARIRGARR